MTSIKVNNFYEGMPFKTYIELEDFLHSSDLKLLQQSVNHWLSKSQFEITQALKLGQLGHTLLLEMDTLTERYLVMPKVDARTKTPCRRTGKQRRKDFDQSG
jgi:hypothetical protein